MTAAALSLSPVSVGVYTALSAASAVTTLATGGIVDDLPENPTFPIVLFAVGEDRQLGGFGSKPGTRTLPEVRLRISVYTQAAGMKTAQDLTDAVLAALADPFDITTSGFSVAAIFHDGSTPFQDSVIAGQKVQEIVSDFRLYVEKAT